MIHFSDKASVFTVQSETPFTKLVFFPPLNAHTSTSEEDARVTGVNRMLAEGKSPDHSVDCC